VRRATAGVVLGITVVVLVAAGRASHVAKPTPPTQPLDGPGGSRYAHAGVTTHRYGEGAGEYWIYEPAEPAARLAPVVLFMHGWGAMNPRAYGAWIDHLVRRGNIVIYPRFQSDLRTESATFTPNALDAARDALHRLATEPGHATPAPGQFAVVGHSVGGLLAANVAARAADSGLPIPRAVMAVEPGRTTSNAARGSVALADLATIPGGTLLLAIAGDADRVVGDADARRIYEETTQLAAADKDYVTLVSDDHGEPAINADHFAPTAADDRYDAAQAGGAPTQGGHLAARLRARRARLRNAGADALDFYGPWKLFDALCDAAFRGTNRAYALGNTAEQRYMGRWSDGQPVHELRVGLAR
jgi:pimeloyl-ACP methyl ester carboxylesterase